MSTNETGYETYHIPSWNMGKLRDKIFKMNNKAAKLDCPEIHLEVINEYQRKAPGYEDAVLAPMITVFEVAIHGEGPKIEGWKFIGTLDHNTLPGSVIVNTVPGEFVPQEFYDHDATCDHCGYVRRRNETFILEDDDQQYKQVGRQCLTDFFGHDPKAVARYLTGLTKFINSLDDEEWYGGGGRAEYTFDKVEVLKATAAVIRESGWVPRSQADDIKVATADIVMNVFLPPSTGERIEWERWVNNLHIDHERNVKDAENALEWLEKQPSDNNEYMHNLHQIAVADGVPIKMFGYWCSLVSSYYRALERQIAEVSTNKLNEYFGKVKERLIFEAEVVSSRSVFTEWGGCHIIKMLDNDGRTIMWFTGSGGIELEIGHKYLIKATIKKHEEYNNWKQTHVTRVAVIDEIAVAA